MSELLDIDGVGGRSFADAGITDFRTEDATMQTKAFHRGEITHGDIQVVTGLRERTASLSGGCSPPALRGGKARLAVPTTLRGDVNQLGKFGGGELVGNG